MVPISASQLAELHPTSLPVHARAWNCFIHLSVTNSSFGYSFSNNRCLPIALVVKQNLYYGGGGGGGGGRGGVILIDVS